MGGQPSVGPSNEEVVSTYDSLAGLYDRLVAPLHTRTRQNALELGPVRPGARVVEIGSGPGRGAVALAERVGPAGEVITIDAARRMLERAQSRVDRWHLSSTVTLVHGDARRLPVRSNQADGVFIEDTLELFSADEMATVLEQSKRILDGSGRLIVITMEREGAERSPFVRAYDWAFQRIPGFQRFGCRPIYARRAIEAAGFEVLVEERARRGLVWPVSIFVAKPIEDGLTE